MKLLIVAVLMIFTSTNVLAVNPSEVLKSPILEKRARDVSKNLRCLVCQNQSIDDSDAELARDLRLLVRERIKTGDTNEQVIEYVVSRYGDFVLLKPPFKTSTYVLWVGPALVLMIGIMALIILFRRRKGQAVALSHPSAPLSKEEARRLEKLMGDSKE